MIKNISLLDKSRTGLLVVDIQDKILKAMARPDEVVENTIKLIKGFKILNCPIFVTEQYPEGLGGTVKAIKKFIDDIEIYEKSTFSCCGIDNLVNKFRSSKIDQIVLCGIEAHVCVWQTAMDLIYENFSVSVVRDAVCSRKDSDMNTAVDRMAVAGINITTTEMVLFELLERIDVDEFKPILKLIK